MIQNIFHDITDIFTPASVLISPVTATPVSLGPARGCLTIDTHLSLPSSFLAGSGELSSKHLFSLSQTYYSHSHARWRAATAGAATANNEICHWEI